MPVSINLTAPLARAANYNANPVPHALAAVNTTDVLGYVVLDRDGAIVSEFYAAGRTAVNTADVHGVTKSWTALLACQLIDRGQLNLSSTLYDVFTDEWPAGVDDDSSKRSITISQLLAMKSGLKNRPYDALQPQDTLLQALNHARFDPSLVGWPTYLYSTSILSYVIRKASGQTPLQYASVHLLPALGISPFELSWQANAEGVEYSAFGLEATPTQLAKLARLMLQGGLATETWRVLSAELSEASLRNQQDNGTTLDLADDSIDGFAWLKYLFGGPGSICRSGVADGGGNDGCA